MKQVTTSNEIPNANPWDDQNVRKSQMEDPDIRPILEAMEPRKRKPSWQEIAQYSPTTKRYCALWESLELRKGNLYRKWETGDDKDFRWQLNLPRSRIETVLKELTAVQLEAILEL